MSRMIRWLLWRRGGNAGRLVRCFSKRLDHQPVFDWTRACRRGMLFAGMGMLGYAIAPAWIVLLGVAFIASIGKGTMDAGLNNFASANYGASEMNWLHACWGIGLTIAPAVVTHFVLYEGSGWQSSYVAGWYCLATDWFWSFCLACRSGESGPRAIFQRMSGRVLRRNIRCAGQL